MRYLWLILMVGCAGHTIGQPSDYSHLPKNECKQECGIDYRFCRQASINRWRCHEEFKSCKLGCK